MMNRVSGMGVHKHGTWPKLNAEWYFGWRYHHIGIPTNVPRPGKQYLEKFKVYVPGFDTTGIQWMRYGPDSPVHSLISLSPT